MKTSVTFIFIIIIIIAIVVVIIIVGGVGGGGVCVCVLVNGVQVPMQVRADGYPGLNLKVVLSCKIRVLRIEVVFSIRAISPVPRLLYLITYKSLSCPNTVS